MAGQKQAVKLPEPGVLEEQRRNKDTKRIYFGGLFDCVSESEIRHRLCKYGDISNVQIVQRRNESGDILKTFAYIDIDATSEAISKCFSEYNKCKWKGHEIKIQLAKESYEKRLQREWQEVKSIQAEGPVTSKIHKELYDQMEEAVSKTKHITPGSKINDKKNWVIGKYGRPLPVVYLRSKGPKVQKFDPSKHCHQLKKIKYPEKASEDDHEIGNLTWNIPGDKKIKKSKKVCKPNTEKLFDVVENEAENNPMRNLTYINGNRKIKTSKVTYKSNKTDNGLDAYSEEDSATVQKRVQEPPDQDAKDEDSDCSMESSDTESIKDNANLSDSIISQIRNSKKECKPMNETTSSVGNDSRMCFPGKEIDFDDLRGNESLMASFNEFLRSSKVPMEKRYSSDIISMPKHGDLVGDRTDKVYSGDKGIVSDESSASRSGDEDNESDEDDDIPFVQSDKGHLIDNFEVDSSTSSEDNEAVDMESDSEEDIQEAKWSFENGESNDSEVNSVSSSEDSEEKDDRIDSEKHESQQAITICNGAKADEGKTKPLSIRNELCSKHSNDIKVGKVFDSDKNLEVNPPSNASVKDSSKKKLSEEKRLDSLMEKSVKGRKEKEIVKAALKNVDPQMNDQKHVIFGICDDADSTDSVEGQPNITGNNANTSTEKIKGKAALSWLGLSSSEEEDSTHDEGERFEIRPQFEGPTGQKLLKLQQRVGSDERFKIDERFLDDENVPESLEAENMEIVAKSDDSTNLRDVENEKSRALSILDRLLGTMSSQRNLRKTPRETSASSDLYQEPVRYDPLNIEHSQYTIAEDVSNDSAGEQDDGNVTHETEINEKPQPEVSKEAFFDVTPSLKNLFGNQTSSSFTFLSDPVEERPIEDHPPLNDVKTPSVIKKSKPVRLSSDEEDNCDGYFEDTAKNAQSEKPASVAVNDCKRFFFTLSDPRLASSTVDGPAAFMRTLSLEELERTLDETRETIRQNFKKKHKDSLRRRRKRDGNFAGLR